MNENNAIVSTLRVIALLILILGLIGSAWVMINVNGIFGLVAGGVTIVLWAVLRALGQILAKA